MVTKAQPRQWKTPDLDDCGRKARARVDQMSFDVERIAALLAGARRSDPPEGWLALVERKARDNAWLLEMESEFDQRPTIRERRAALTKVRDLAGDLYTALRELDDESSKALAVTLPNPWDATHWQQVKEVRREPARLCLAAELALLALPAPDSTRFAVKRAVSRLADVWEILTEGRRPGRQNRPSKDHGPHGSDTRTETAGAFAELVELALRPALPSHKPFDAAIREGLKLPPFSSWT